LKRREFIALLGGTAATWPLAASAQQASASQLIGILVPISSAAAARNMAAFRAGLRDLGYVEGRNITITIRYAEGAVERMPALAAELAALNPAVIVAGSPAAALAVRKITRTIPIVMNSSTNPIAIGLATSLSAPGGNVTGFWWGDEGLLGKHLELLKEAVPGLVRVGVIVDPDDPTTNERLKPLPAISRALGLEARVIEVRAPTDFDAAFATATKEKLQGLQMSISPLIVSYRAELAALAAKAQLPAVYGIREFVAAGGLMSYGTSLPDLYRRKALFVDKILKGASPADLPIERPTKFELAISLKAAKGLGLTISLHLQQIADEVIE
jgi:putative ABC transport system substrate-binding protein